MNDRRCWGRVKVNRIEARCDNYATHAGPCVVTASFGEIQFWRRAE